MGDTEAVDITRADAAMFIGLTAYLESYFMDPEPHTLHVLAQRCRRDLVRYGLATDELADQARAMHEINQRLRAFLGEI